MKQRSNGQRKRSCWQKKGLVTLDVTGAHGLNQVSADRLSCSRVWRTEVGWRHMRKNEYELFQGLENTKVTDQGGDRGRKGEEPVSMSQCH